MRALPTVGICIYPTLAQATKIFAIGSAMHSSEVQIALSSKREFFSSWRVRVRSLVEFSNNSDYDTNSRSPKKVDVNDTPSTGEIHELTIETHKSILMAWCLVLIIERRGAVIHDQILRSTDKRAVTNSHRCDCQNENKASLN
jgi:hypothetical protein